MGERDINVQRKSTWVFGYLFRHIPDDVRENLETLQRESAVYSDQWVAEIGDFRQVRIAFTESERKEFARRCWAYERWLEAGRPQWAREAVGIDQDVAADADSYTMNTRDGHSFGPPYHCLEAFLGRHLEVLVCHPPAGRKTVMRPSGQAPLRQSVERVIAVLTPAIRAFNSRERGLARWDITREDDVRDLLYAMLRPLIIDLNKEEAVPSRGGTYKVVDLFSKAARLMIEVKWIQRRRQWKRAIEQIQVDIQSYIAHPACETLLFIIVDMARDIPDPRQLEATLSGDQRIDGKVVNVRLYVVEP